MIDILQIYRIILIYCCPLKLFLSIKNKGWFPRSEFSPFSSLCFLKISIQGAMNENTHFSGQPMYGLLINMLNKE